MPKVRNDRGRNGPIATGAKGGRGQHFLVNNSIVSRIITASKLKGTDTVLEIGPGTGNMTVKLLEVVKKVIVIEIDPRLIVELRKRVQGTPSAAKLHIIHGDALKVQWPHFDVCCANIPYQISSPLTFKLLAHRPFFRAAVLMYQDEFARRVCASPSSSMYCRLAVNAQLLARCRLLFLVKKCNFRPPPLVESRIVRIEPRNPPPPINFIEWDGMVRHCFGRKNKQLGAIFLQKKLLRQLNDNLAVLRAAGGGGGGRSSAMDTGASSATAAAAAIAGAIASASAVAPIPLDDARDARARVEAALDETALRLSRSSKLAIDDFLRLLVAFNKHGIHFS